jgi:hypothetical protein
MCRTYSLPWVPISSFVNAVSMLDKIGGRYSWNSLTASTSSIFSIKIMSVLRQEST